MPPLTGCYSPKIAWIRPWASSGSRVPLRCVWTPPTRSFSSHINNRPKVIFSGIQPTGIPHLGNYLGALQQWVKLQNEAEHDTTLLYSLVDLHAITIRQNPEELRLWKRQSLAMLLAVGLDPKRSIIFRQSDVPAHTELMWILSCQASTGYLNRMTQWKEKTANERENAERLKLGLFSYPVLQAADVLVHGSTHVPVGHDQAQHLEFARELAIGFNNLYGPDVLTPPETILSPAKRIMSLTNPMSKMSKSALNAKSRIALTDSEVVIRSKIQGAVTDSIKQGAYHDIEKRPGVSNLMELARYCNPPGDSSKHDDIVADLNGLSMQALKSRVAQIIEETIRPIREKYQALISDTQSLDNVADDGADRARQNAAATLARVQHAIGLR